MYASRHPRMVAGLVLVDGVHPRYHRRQFQALKHLIPESEWPEAYPQLCAVPSRQLDWEQMDIRRSEHQARAQWPHRLSAPCHWRSSATDGPRVRPHQRPTSANRSGTQLEHDLAALLPDATHTIARRSGHDIAHSQPGLVLRHILEVVADVREHR